MVERGHERAHVRVTVDAFVRVLGDQREYVFRTRDLSEGGLFLYTKVGHLYPFYIGAELQIELYDFDQAVTFMGQIVRVVDKGTDEAERFPAGFGVKIATIDDANRARLAELLARAKRGEPLY